MHLFSCTRVTKPPMEIVNNFTDTISVSLCMFDTFKPRCKLNDLIIYILDAVTSSGIFKAKQIIGVTFNFDKQDVIDLTKISKLTMCSA